MDLPDYAAATEAADTLVTDHKGQHRCTDGTYYTPRNFADCPHQTAVAVLVATLDAARTLPHVACHDTEHVDALVSEVTGLEPDDGWRLTFRQVLEANAARLDPSVVHDG